MDLGEVLRGKGTIFILSTVEIKVIKVLVSDGRTPIFIGNEKGTGPLKLEEDREMHIPLSQRGVMEARGKVSC